MIKRQTPLITATILFVFVIILIGVNFNSRTPPLYAALPNDHPVITNDLIMPLSRMGATSNDLFLPGTQPNQIDDDIKIPAECRACHQGYSDQVDQDSQIEPWTGWQGSMMAQAGRDPLFYAALDIANADIPGGGEYCLRCHMPRGWLNGRATPTDGSAMTPEDLEGVQCEVCHRMVDPIYTEGESPQRDQSILSAITPPVTRPGNSSMIVDPLDWRRGPFDIVSDWDGLDPHLANAARGTLPSPFHQESQFCGTCHDIDNPLLSWDEDSQSYQPNPPDTPADPTDKLFPIERTFTEWSLSAYNSPDGIYAPQFGGNKTYVSTCQDCHMRDVTGIGGQFFSTPASTRNDLPMHDLTGANTWVPQIIPLHPVFSATINTDPARSEALDLGIERARYMLQNAATVHAVKQGSQLAVTVINQTGHKLPSGYVEGRRMWLQVEGYDDTGTLVYSSGAYDVATAVLTGYGTDPTLKVYESKQGLTQNWADEFGLPAGESFHFILNNMVVSDNRIPPRGYAFDTFNAGGAAPHTAGQPDPTLYADGQYWDTTYYQLPDTVVTGTVRLLYQVASDEYIEFLLENNPDPDNPDNNGQILFDLWEMTERSRPEIMAEIPFLNLHNFLPTIITSQNK